MLVTLRAIDINGEKDEDGDYKGLRSDPVTFAVVINDLNDAPRAGSIGNWWVTVNEGLEATDVSAGEWLRFSLETAGDDYPAFTDQDLKAGDSLTYVLTGPRWLQIDADTGEITNKEGMLPARGVYRVTVTATDEDGQSASKSFNLNVALSRPDNDNNNALTEDNRDPDMSFRDTDYDELSGNQRIATVTVTDPDQDIPDHQFALKTVKIIRIHNPDNNADPNNVALRDHDDDDRDNDGLVDTGRGLASEGEAATPMRLWTSGKTDANGDPAEDEGYAAAIELSDPIPISGGWTLYVEAVDTDPSPRWDTTWLLDHEGNVSRRVGGVAVERLHIRVAAIDGTQTSVLAASTASDAGTGSNSLLQDGTPNDDAEHRDIRILIEDVNEAPTAPRASSTDSAAVVTAPPVATADLAVEQQALGVKLIYINLDDLWTDPDEGDDNDLTYRASSSVSWIEIKHGPTEWDEIESDVTWGAADSTANETASTIGAAPAAGSNTMVVVVEIDRTERHDQGDSGSFTLTATDDDNDDPATGSRTYTVTPTDEDINIESDSVAVTISGGVREDGTLRANFDDNEDPDLAGSLTPAVALYTWYRVDADANGDPDSTATPAVIVQTTSNTYTPTQSDVDHFIGVVVNYYELSALDLSVSGSGSTAFVARAGEELTDNPIAAVTLVTLAGDSSNDPDSKASITSVVVANSPDRGTADITILANEDKLSVSNDGLRIVDGDYPSITGVRLVTETEEADPNDSAVIIGIEDITVSFEVSSNGRGGWTAVDEDDVDYVPADSGAGTPGMTTLSLKDGDGEYYRAVVSYNADTGTDAATERVYSDPIQVANVRNADATAPLAPITITGSLNPGGTLSVNVNARVTVQWQIQESVTVSGSAVTDWVDIPGATGDLRLTQAHAGENIRAVVSYQSRDPDNPGVTAIVATPSQAIGGTPSNVRPVNVDSYEIEGSVDGTGHAAVNGLLAGHNATITHTVPLTSLFQDPDTSRFVLTFGATNLVRDSDDTELVAAPTPTDRTYVYEHEQNASDPAVDVDSTSVLVFEARSGKLTYLSNAYQTHDGDPADGAGNVLKLNISADDPGPGTPATGAVTLRINVAPTDIHFDQVGTGSGDLTGIVSTYTNTADATDAATRISGITVNELVEATGEEVLAKIDVQDENWAGVRGGSPGHEFGKHEVTVVGDDRFVITKSGGPTARRDSDSDGSTWELRLKKGAMFDHETDDMDPHTKGTQIELTFMATDGGGLSTPDATGPVHLGGNGYNPIELVITVANNPADDPPRPGPKETPGLKDNNENNDMDDTNRRRHGQRDGRRRSHASASGNVARRDHRRLHRQHGPRRTGPARRLSPHDRRRA